MEPRQKVAPVIQGNFRLFFQAKKPQLNSLLENNGWVQAGDVKLDSGEKIIKILAMEDYYEPTPIHKIYLTPESSAFPHRNGRQFIMPIDMDEFEQKYY